MKPLAKRQLSEQERATLRRWVRSGQTALYQRARTVLLAAEAGLSGAAIARALGLHPNTIRRWLGAFARGGVAALAPKRRGGRARQFGPDVTEALLRLLREPPARPDRPARYWTLRELAAELQRTGVVAAISIETIRRLLSERGIPWQSARAGLAAVPPPPQPRRPAPPPGRPRRRRPAENQATR